MQSATLCAHSSEQKRVLAARVDEHPGLAGRINGDPADRTNSHPRYDGTVVEWAWMKKRDDTEKVLGPLEAEVMRHLWAADGPVTVRAIVERLNSGRPKQLAYTTVMTVMSRLAERGVLRRHREGRGYVYEAADEDAAGLAVREVMRDFGDAALAQFVHEARADP